MVRKYGILILLTILLEVIVAPPVDPAKKVDSDGKEEELDDYGLEYGRYLQQVVQALEEDKEFAKKLENVSNEQIRSGNIAKELEFVKHNVRSKLDELKRIEVDRLRKLLQEQMERSELGLYRDEDGHLLNSPDGRRWRTIRNRNEGLKGGGDGNFWLGLNRKGIKLPQHIDIGNPHSFEIDDLKKLIQTATSDLEALDKQRREEFKKYELEKEAKYRESLKNMSDDVRKETEKHHKEMVDKHKEHPKIHHPGSKPQLEQVWEDQDHMPREEFNPKTFFAMHDVNGDGHLDVEEVEAILIPEVKKMYNPNNEEDDPAEMEEEFHRMREHIFNETDENKDGLISLIEFLKMTQQQDFQQDEGWKSLDEQTIYTEEELQEFMRQREMQMRAQQQLYPQPYGDQRVYYDVQHGQPAVPPHINYQGGHEGIPPQPNYHQQGYGNVPPQQVHGYQQQYQPPPHGQQPYQAPHMQQGMPPQQQYQAPHGQQGAPQQQQFQAPHGQQGVPQQQYQAPHGQQGVPQQQYQAPHGQQGVPQQQYHGQQGVPQQQFQGQHNQQGIPQQQFQAQHNQQGIPPQQQYQASHGQQGVPSQQQFQPQHGGQQEQLQANQVNTQQFQATGQQPQYQPAAQQKVNQAQQPPETGKSNSKSAESVNQIQNTEAKDSKDSMKKQAPGKTLS